MHHISCQDQPEHQIPDGENSGDFDKSMDVDPPKEKAPGQLNRPDIHELRRLSRGYPRPNSIYTDSESFLLKQQKASRRSQVPQGPIISVEVSSTEDTFARSASTPCSGVLNGGGSPARAQTTPPLHISVQAFFRPPQVQGVVQTSNCPHNWSPGRRSATRMMCSAPSIRPSLPLDRVTVQ